MLNGRRNANNNIDTCIDQVSREARGQQKRSEIRSRTVDLPLMTGSRSLSQVINNNIDIIFSSSTQQQNYKKKYLVHSQTNRLSPNNKHNSQAATSSLRYSLEANTTVRSRSGKIFAQQLKTIDNLSSGAYSCPTELEEKTHRRMNHHTIINPSPVILLTLCAIALGLISSVDADAALYSNMQKLKVSPDIIDIPRDLEQIKVELHGNTVKPGDPIPAKSFRDINILKTSWDISNNEAQHTLLLLDLDRKSRNNSQSIFNQFTSVNIPGNYVVGGQAIVSFDMPVVSCQPNTKHRILMLAFHQSQTIDISDISYMAASTSQSAKRENFRLNDFINRHRLNLVAANVFSLVGGESGICSSSTTLNSIQSLSSILIAMVIAKTTLGLAGRTSFIY